jgi:hypothetical protein
MASGRRAPVLASVTFTERNAAPPELASTAAGSRASGFIVVGAAAT